MRMLIPFVIAAIVSGCALTPQGCISLSQVINTTMLLPATPERSQRLEYYKALYAGGGCIAAHDPQVLEDLPEEPKAGTIKLE